MIQKQLILSNTYNGKTNYFVISETKEEVNENEFVMIVTDTGNNFIGILKRKAKYSDVLITPHSNYGVPLERIKKLKII